MCEIEKTTTNMSKLWLRMLNGDCFSDTTFVVGPEKYVVKAHRAVLTVSSEVFETMFSGSFPTQDQIEIEDIDKEDFIEMLHYIYTHTVNLTKLNMIGMLYAAEKYLLVDLKKKCELFILKNINHQNLLVVLDAGQLLNSVIISDSCFAILLDDPIKYFEDKRFLEISENVLKAIIRQPRINCCKADLKRATAKWLKANKQLTADRLTDEAFILLKSKMGVEKSEFSNKQLKTVDICGFGQYTVEKVWQTITIFKKTNCYLHGVGVYLGVFPEEGASADPSYYNDTLNITVFINGTYAKVYQSTVTQTNSMSIFTAMFEKLEIKDEMPSISVDFGTEKRRIVNRKSVCQNCYSFCNVRECCEGVHAFDTCKWTLVAYLICRDKTVDEKKIKL
jgi:hypothetical protein